MEHVHAVVVLDKGPAQGHAAAQGHPLGGEVAVPDDGKDLRHAQAPEGVLPAGGSGLGGKALMPPVPAEVVADLRHLPLPPVLEGEAALAHHLPGGLLHHGPQAEAVLCVAVPLPVQPGLDLPVGKGVLVGVHHLLVLQDGPQGGEVRLIQLPQRQPLCL